jgi:hypothetical protein
MIYDKGYVITHEDSSKFLGTDLSLPIRVVGKKPYIVKEDDTFFSIANKEFTDTVMWYEIALLNPEISDPIVLELGVSIFLPVHGTSFRR